MNIIVSSLLSLLFSLINNTILLAKIIEKSRELNLKIDFNNLKTKKIIKRELLLQLIPIINLLNCLQIDVNFLNNETRFIYELEDLGILRKMTNWEEQNIKMHSSFLGILYKELKYKQMIKESNKLSLENNGEIIYFVNKMGEVIILKTSGLLKLDENDLQNIIRQNDDKEKENKQEKRIIITNYPIINNPFNIHRNLKLVRKKHN